AHRVVDEDLSDTVDQKNTTVRRYLEARRVRKVRDNVNTLEIRGKLRIQNIAIENKDTKDNS
ncbi:MAG: hypothetical protein ABJP86_04610, partial [Flavobacteriaceae bacterium]